MDNGNLSNTDMGYMPTDEENDAVCTVRNDMARLTDGGNIGLYLEPNRYGSLGCIT